MSEKITQRDYNGIEDLFTDYYDRREWSGGGDETVSGSGSTMRRTERLREELPKLLAELKVERILDAPCGDYNWFQHVERPGIHYSGGDIVQKMIADNLEKYADQNTNFMHFNILEDQAEKIDLWFCRDTLLHFSFANIKTFLHNFISSGTPYLLVSNYHQCTENIDIPTGAGRELNLQIAPFNLPEPKNVLPDSSRGERPKVMALWHRDQIVSVMK